MRNIISIKLIQYDKIKQVRLYPYATQPIQTHLAQWTETWNEEMRHVVNGNRFLSSEWLLYLIVISVRKKKEDEKSKQLSLLSKWRSENINFRKEISCYSFEITRICFFFSSNCWFLLRFVYEQICTVGWEKTGSCCSKEQQPIFFGKSIFLRETRI